MRKAEKRLDGKARRAARRQGWYVTKSRKAEDANNLGGYMLVDAETNGVVAGSRYELSAEEVIEMCRG